LDNPAITSLDFATMLFSGAGCQPCVHPPTILEDRLDCFLVWAFIMDQSGMGGPTSSYGTANIAPLLIRPHKPHHHCQGHAIPRWGHTSFTWLNILLLRVITKYSCSLTLCWKMSSNPAPCAN
jgi:hypothetical protein